MANRNSVRAQSPIGRRCYRAHDNLSKAYRSICVIDTGDIMEELGEGAVTLRSSANGLFTFVNPLSLIDFICHILLEILIIPKTVFSSKMSNTSGRFSVVYRLHR